MDDEGEDAFAELAGVLAGRDAEPDVRAHFLGPGTGVVADLDAVGLAPGGGGDGVPVFVLVGGGSSASTGRLAAHGFGTPDAE